MYLVLLIPVNTMWKKSVEWMTPHPNPPSMHSQINAQLLITKYWNLFLKLHQWVPSDHCTMTSKYSTILIIFLWIHYFDELIFQNCMLQYTSIGPNDKVWLYNCFPLTRDLQLIFLYHKLKAYTIILCAFTGYAT